MLQCYCPGFAIDVSRGKWFMALHQVEGASTGRYGQFLPRSILAAMWLGSKTLKHSSLLFSLMSNAIMHVFPDRRDALFKYFCVIMKGQSLLVLSDFYSQRSYISQTKSRSNLTIPLQPALCAWDCFVRHLQDLLLEAALLPDLLKELCLFERGQSLG